MSETGPQRRPPNLRHRARRAAVQALYQWQLTGQPPEQIVRQLVEDGGQGRLDQRFLRELVLGTTQQVEALDSALAPHLDRPVPQLDQVERAILRLGAYELMERLEVPLRVVINEAVELAKTYGAEASHRYVNGVLDRVARAVRPEAGGVTRPQPS